jgi:uncharacterized phage-associated protein
MARYAVTDISNYFIDHFARSVDPMTLPRVQMFVYFAQVESLRRYGQSLFDDEIRAYSSGPAVTRLNAYYEGAGNDYIKVYRTFDKSKFSRQDLNLLMDVAVYYNSFSTSQLQIMAFVKGGPWEQVYSEGSEMLPISNEMIRAFYSDQPGIPSYIDTVYLAIESCCGVNTMPALGLDESIEAPTLYTEDAIMGTWD